MRDLIIYLVFMFFVSLGGYIYFDVYDESKEVAEQSLGLDSYESAYKHEELY